MVINVDSQESSRSIDEVGRGGCVSPLEGWFLDRRAGLDLLYNLA